MPAVALFVLLLTSIFAAGTLLRSPHASAINADALRAFVNKQVGKARRSWDEANEEFAHAIARALVREAPRG